MADLGHEIKRTWDRLTPNQKLLAVGVVVTSFVPPTGLFVLGAVWWNYFGKG